MVLAFGVITLLVGAFGVAGTVRENRALLSLVSGTTGEGTRILQETIQFSPRGSH